MPTISWLKFASIANSRSFHGPLIPRCRSVYRASSGRWYQDYILPHSKDLIDSFFLNVGAVADYALYLVDCHPLTTFCRRRKVYIARALSTFI